MRQILHVSWVSGGSGTEDLSNQSAARLPGRADPDRGSRDHWGPDPWGSERLMVSRRLDVLSLVPLAAIMALVALVASLVWILSQTDAERARTKLATDALWVEQTLRFQMSVNEDMLARLALDAAGGASTQALQARARVHIAANPEMVFVRWYDAQGNLVAAVPEGAGGEAEARLTRQLRAVPAQTARPIFGPVEGGVAAMGLRQPSSAGGVVVAGISLPVMLERHIPWWIAEQYAVRLLPAAGQPVRGVIDRAHPEPALAERARRPVAAGAPQHAISFDPPLAGTVLQITAYDRPATFGSTAILIAILGLAAFAVLALVVLHRNALHRRRAEDRLRAEMAFRSAMEESLTVGLRAKDHAGRILYVNAAFCRLVGHDAATLIGHLPPMPYWASDAIEETLARQRALNSGPPQPQSFETRFRRADGAEIAVQVYEAPLIDAAGRHQGWMGSVIDITEAKRAARTARMQQDNLARTGRLVTLGEMASTLAHELNQPLGAIASYAAGAQNLLAAGRADPALLMPALEKLAAQARRAGLIIRRVQDFVKKREPQLVPLDLAEVAAGAIGLMAAEAREMRVRLHLEGAEAPAPVLADRILLEQVLVNLIRNGMEAMAEADSRAEPLTLRLVPEEDGLLRLDVMDRGPGIPPDLAAQLFDPFTSTKSHGMGMGLNICRSITEMLHGSLAHAPRKGGGTVFTLRLPLAPNPSAPPLPEEPA